MTRRRFMNLSLAASARLGLAWRLERGFSSASEFRRVDELASEYAAAYDVPGLSLAYGRGDRILFTRAYGKADRHMHEPVTPLSLFRIASITKPFTSAAIFTLVEAGTLRTSDHVFGAAGILSNFTLRSHADWLQAITVEHLLTHTSGGWPNKNFDPMIHVKDRGHTAVIQGTLDSYPMQFAPGRNYAYSNFGYFLLGRVIEKVSGIPYGEYVRQHVQTPLGITDMRLATETPAPGEVHYYGQGRDDPYAFPIAMHDSIGGWIATPTDLVRFALAVFSPEDRAGAPELLKADTLRQMTTASKANPEYACGWDGSAGGDRFHSGGLPGTASFLMHRHDGLAWAVVVNTRREHSKMEKDLHQLSWDIARALQM